MLHLDEFFQFSFGWKKGVTIYQLAHYCFWPAEGALVLDCHQSWGFPTISLIKFMTGVRSQMPLNEIVCLKRHFICNSTQLRLRRGLASFSLHLVPGIRILWMGSKQ